MAFVMQHRAPARDLAVPTGGALEPAALTDAVLAYCTHTDYLTRENIRQMLPRLLAQLVSPSAGTAADEQDLLVKAHFVADAHLSHPLGYAIGAQQIAALFKLLRVTRSILFPTVELVTLRSLFDEQHESAALEVKAVLRLRGLGLPVPVLVQVFVELVDRRDSHPGALWISYWSEHYSLRSMATMLPGPLARWVDWGCRRGLALAAQHLAGMLTGGHGRSGTERGMPSAASSAAGDMGALSQQMQAVGGGTHPHTEQTLWLALPQVGKRATP